METVAYWPSNEEDPSLGHRAGSVGDSRPATLSSFSPASTALRRDSPASAPKLSCLGEPAFFTPAEMRSKLRCSILICKCRRKNKSLNCNYNTVPLRECRDETGPLKSRSLGLRLGPISKSMEGSWFKVPCEETRGLASPRASSWPFTSDILLRTSAIWAFSLIRTPESGADRRTACGRRSRSLREVTAGAVKQKCSEQQIWCYCHFQVIVQSIWIKYYIND